jgi:hypothetical protein
VPSPIAHSLIGLAVGVAVLRPRGEPVGVTVRTRALPLLGFAALAAVVNAANLVPALREAAIGGALLAAVCAWTGRRPRAAAVPGVGP